MSLFSWFKHKEKPQDICAHCGAVGHFGRSDSAGPVCDECARKIILEVITETVLENTKADMQEILTCDSCGNNIPRSTGYALSTPQVLLSPFYWEFLISKRKLINNDAALALFVNQVMSETNPWFICEKCSQYFYFSREIAKSEASKIRPQPPGSNKVKQKHVIAVAGIVYSKFFGQWPSMLQFDGKIPDQKTIESLRSVVYNEKWLFSVAQEHGFTIEDREAEQTAALTAHPADKKTVA